MKSRRYLSNQLSFHLVYALEVSHFGHSPLYESIEARFHELGHAAAEDSLLSEEVCFGLFAEGCLEDAGPSGSDRRGICERIIPGFARGVLMYRDKRRDALALLVLGADGMPGSLGSDHYDVDVGRSAIWLK